MADEATGRVPYRRRGVSRWPGEAKSGPREAVMEEKRIVEEDVRRRGPGDARDRVAEQRITRDDMRRVKVHDKGEDG